MVEVSLSITSKLDAWLFDNNMRSTMGTLSGLLFETNPEPGLNTNDKVGSIFSMITSDFSLF